MSLSSPFTINKILQNVNLDRAQQRQIQDQQNVMQEKQEPTKTGFLNKALDLLSRGNYASANVTLDLVNGGGFTPIKSAVDGFTGKSKTVYSDVLGEMGVENQWVKSGLGWVLDIGLDPITYLGVGAATKGGALGLKFAGKVIPGTTKVLSLLGDTAKFAGKVAGKSETLEKFGQWFGKSFIPNFRPMEVSEKDWAKLMKFKNQYDEALRLGQGEVYDNVFRYSRQYTQKERELIGNTMQKMMSGEKATAEVIDKELITLGLKDDKLRSVATEIRLAMNKMYTEEAKRGIMETFKQGYMPGVYKKMSSTGRWSRPKVFDNFEAAKRAGYEPIEDASLLYGIRGVSSARQTMVKDFFENLKNTFGTAVKEGEMLPGMERVHTPWLVGTAFPKEIAKHIDSMETFIGDKGVVGFLQLYDKALSVWKGTVTSLFPAFHIRNGISNVWNAFLAGMKNPMRFYQALDMQKLARAIKLKDTATIAKLADKEIVKGIPLKEMVWQAKKTSVMNAGWMGKELSAEAITQRGFLGNITAAVSENVGQKGTKKMIIEKANPLNALRTGREVGVMVENNSRLALFIDRVAKGDSFDEAAKTVKKYLFDYGELTNLEQKGMRRVVPFYTWMRKNIPLQVEQMVKQPGKFAGLEKVRNEIERASENQKDPEKYLPSWMKNQYTIRMPWKNGTGDYAYLSPSIAFQDLSSGTSLNRWLAQISPFIKAPFEYAVNYDLFRRKQLADDNLPPDLKNWEKARAEVMNNLRIAGVFSRLSDEEKTLTEKILKETFGQPTYYYNLAQGKKTYKATKLREKSAEKKYKKSWKESTSKGIMATFRKFIQ